jgi:hypothetical protein
VTLDERLEPLDALGGAVQRLPRVVRLHDLVNLRLLRVLAARALRGSLRPRRRRLLRALRRGLALRRGHAGQRQKNHTRE